jgi:hypothetical protein
MTATTKIDLNPGTTTIVRGVGTTTVQGAKRVKGRLALDFTKPRHLVTRAADGAEAQPTLAFRYDESANLISQAATD